MRSEMADVGYGSLDQDPLDLLERHLVFPPVVEPGRSRALVVRHRHLQGCPVFQVLGDARRPERVTPDLRLNAGLPCPPSDHPPHVGLRERPVGESLRSPSRRAKRRSLRIIP